ncbi:MAG: beta-propeller domain-containing protein [Bacillota bacterium]
MIIASVDLSADEPVAVDAYLGAGDNIYVSRSNMYVAVTGYEAAAGFRAPRVSTQVYRFALKQGRLESNGMGKVPGTALNQFSMDEYEGYFPYRHYRG